MENHTETGTMQVVRSSGLWGIESDSGNYLNEVGKGEHAYYNKKNFPIFVLHHGNWDIYRNETFFCAAIAVKVGCKSSHFGDSRHILKTFGIKLI